MKHFLVCILVGIGLPCVALSQGLTEKKQSLQKTKEKIQDQKKQLDSLKGKEQSIVKNLGQIDQKKAVLKDKKGSLEKNIKGIDGEIEKTSMSIEERNRRIQDSQESIGLRLRNLYMYGEINYLKMLLTSMTFEDLGQKRYLVANWVEKDRQKIVSFEEEARALGAEKASLVERKTVKDRDLHELEKTEKEIAQERLAKKKLLTMVKSQKDYYQKSIQELEQASKNLETLIHQFKKSKPTKGEPSLSRFGQMRGRLLMPVRGTVEKKYGAYEDTRLHINLYQKGIDIRAPEGTAVNAVFDGKVAYADWFAGYGKVVILDHDGGYFTLYAHLSEIQVKMGHSVTIGDDVGKVGDTESLKGDYLYFELREKGVTVNPLPWFDR